MIRKKFHFCLLQPILFHILLPRPVSPSSTNFCSSIFWLENVNGTSSPVLLLLQSACTLWCYPAGLSDCIVLYSFGIQNLISILHLEVNGVASFETADENAFSANETPKHLTDWKKFGFGRCSTEWLIPETCRLLWTLWWASVSYELSKPPWCCRRNSFPMDFARWGPDDKPGEEIWQAASKKELLETHLHKSKAPIVFCSDCFSRENGRLLQNGSVIHWCMQKESFSFHTSEKLVFLQGCRLPSF